MLTQLLPGHVLSALSGRLHSRTKQREIFVISTLKRPVPLEYNLYVNKELYKIVDARREFLNDGYEPGPRVRSYAPKLRWRRTPENAVAEALARAATPRLCWQKTEIRSRSHQHSCPPDAAAAECHAVGRPATLEPRQASSARASSRCVAWRSLGRRGRPGRPTPSRYGPASKFSLSLPPSDRTERTGLLLSTFCASGRFFRWWPSPFQSGGARATRRRWRTRTCRPGARRARSKSLWTNHSNV